tara:strand:+ start:4705 stop:5286 length:582 start_codon:yes stop_codon:yes gene_type:complete
MTTIAVVKKNNQIAIAADTLTKWGSGKESAKYIHNSGKIIQVGDNFIAVTGNATFKLILTEYFHETSDEIALRSTEEIFSTWNKLHLKLKEKYFLIPEEDKEDAIESSRMDVLIANPFGIFGVSGHRTVQEFTRFYSYGSGSDYALGAMWSMYESSEISAEKIARKSIEAAAEFDDGTGLPVDSHEINSIKLN